MELAKAYPLMRPGHAVLDLGSWPGGSLQVALQLLEGRGLLVGIDLRKLDDLSSPILHLLEGDLGHPKIQEQLNALSPDGYDLVLSDMSPKLTGIREADRAATAACSELAITAARAGLKPGGAMVIKVFKSPESDQFVKTLRPLFNRVSREELDSSRNTSNEYYLVCL
ncbi:MAG: 23S rRNA methyltransferase, partial [Proteobacteria bacterium]